MVHKVGGIVPAFIKSVNRPAGLQQLFCPQKTFLKTSVGKLRRASSSSVLMGKHANGRLPQESQVSYLRRQRVVLQMLHRVLQ